ncbi:MAG: SDR family NAD(P)-dependent oxidoreductase [Pirellulales bacterium]|nr:SDR family NAD(P)-dependent oxidoreductase [Pirellulales bacterium]
MSKVLVTGATGFIGAHLAEVLRNAGEQIVCTRRSSSNVSRLSGFEIEFVTADITQADSLARTLQGVDVIYHLAGLVKAFRKAEFDRVNIEGTRNLVRAAAALESPPTVVIVSSLAAAGPANDRPLVESDPARPVSVYGRSKLAAELAALEFANQVPISIVRPPIVFGESDRDVFEMFKPIAQHGLHVVAGSGSGRFSLIYAGDLATALQRVAVSGERVPYPECEQDTPDGQGWYFAAHQEHPTYAELGGLIGQALGGKKARVLRMPIAIAWLAAAGSELAGRIRRKPQILNFDKIREARAGGWSCSPDKAINQLGWSPEATLAERLCQTAEWYYDQQWLKRPTDRGPVTG